MHIGKRWIVQVKILTIIRHGREVWSFRLTRPQQFEFKPGQFILFTKKIGGQDVRRAYGLSSAPSTKEYIEITVKLKPEGKFTPVLFGMHEDDTLEMLGPFGIFSFNESNWRTPVFIAGGTGIAPLLSMLRTYLLIPPTNSEAFYLFYGIKKQHDEVFKEELAHMTLEHERFNEVISISEPDPGTNWQGDTGHMGWELIKKYIPVPGNCIFYICGPEAMVHHIIDDLHRHNISDDNIKMDNW